MYVGISILRRTERESAERRPLLPSFTVNARHRRLSDLELFRSIHLRVGGSTGWGWGPIYRRILSAWKAHPPATTALVIYDRALLVLSME